MTSENLRLTAYLNIVRAAEEQPYIKTIDGLIVRGMVAALVWAKIQAEDAGLSPAEIQAAVQIGEDRNPTKANPPLGVDDYAPSNTEDYWEQVYHEAEQFWLERYRGEE